MAEEKKAAVSSVQIKLKAVRLSYPNIWESKAVKQGDEPRYSASFLIDKETQGDQIKKLREAVAKIAHEKWGEKIPKTVKYCVHDGTEKEADGYDENIIFISSSSKKRPQVYDQHMGVMTKDDPIPYAGCYVNAVVRLWTQDNNFGKRVNAELQGIQFHEDGAAFGVAPFRGEEHFTAAEESDEPDSRPPTKAKPRPPREPEPEEDEIPF